LSNCNDRSGKTGGTGVPFSQIAPRYGATALAASIPDARLPHWLIWRNFAAFGASLPIVRLVWRVWDILSMRAAPRADALDS